MTRTVWTTRDRAGHVHDRPDCLGTKTTEYRTRAEYVEVDLAQVRNPLPCKRCFPDLPTLRVWHPFCKICNHKRALPCAHNGAVRVIQPRRGQWTGKFGSSEYDPDSVTYVHRWVWPENAWRFALVEPLYAE